jgi:hypothetical protein
MVRTSNTVYFKCLQLLLLTATAAHAAAEKSGACCMPAEQIGDIDKIEVQHHLSALVKHAITSLKLIAHTIR